MKTLGRFFTGKARSRVYAWAYFACIPLFACLYTISAGDFHHTTVQYERSLSADFDAIRSQLTNSLNRHISKQYGKTQVIDHEWAVRNNTVGLSGGKFENDRFQFSLDLDLEKNGKSGPERMRGNLIDMSFAVESSPMITDAGQILYLMKTINFEGDMAVPFDPYALLVNPPPEFTGKKSEIRFLPIPADLHKRLVAYAYAVRGFPSEASGSVGRMLYFSVVTITTLGYGDILPLTPWARFLVGSEAILGVILVGYYLTSLSNATQLSRDSSMPPSAS